MFRPNQTCWVTPVAGLDLYGQPVLGAREQRRCSVVSVGSRAEIENRDTADAEATVQVPEAILLFPVSLAIGTQIEVADRVFRVTGVFPRYRTNGALDHHVVECAAWR